jgi:hypothetical protein
MIHLRDQIIPARFLLTLGHFIAVLLVNYTRDHHIYAVYDDPTSTEQNDARRELHVALIVAVLCFVCDFLGMFTGTSIFMHKVNFIQILLHFIGGILVCTFVHDSWGFHYFWPLVIIFNITSALVELGVALAVYVFKVVMFGGD